MKPIFMLLGGMLFTLATHLHAAPEEPWKVPTSRALITIKAMIFPLSAPAGANDWSCRSDSQPYPVVLIPGTFNNMQVAWSSLAPRLANSGYCVYSLNYGGHQQNNYFQSLGPLEESNQVIRDFVAEVLQKSGARKVHLVGHSQGGLHALLVARHPLFQGRIETVVGLAPASHGTQLVQRFASADEPSLSGVILDKFCPACIEMGSESDWMQNLEQTPLTTQGVKYHILASRNDKVVVPPSSAFIDEPHVSNQYVQDVCDDDRVSHRGLLYDEETQLWVLNALNDQPQRCL